jgi:hypothetical protein
MAGDGFRFQGEKLGEKKKLTCGSCRAVRGREKEGNGSGEAGMGCGLFLLLGRSVPRGLFYIFFLLFSFSFSIFLFLLDFAY